MPSMLCPACENVFGHDPQPYKEYPHHSCLEKFKLARDQGCLLYNAIWDRIPKAMDKFRTKWSRKTTYNTSLREELMFNSTETMHEPDVLLWVEALIGKTVEPV
jgi:hypothetical protein